MARRFYDRTRVGVAGWSYDDRQGTVYPDPKPPGLDPLAYLADYFHRVETADVVFNNHYRAQAVVNALAFRAMRDDPRVEAPATLAESYPREVERYDLPVAET